MKRISTRSQQPGGGQRGVALACSIAAYCGVALVEGARCIAFADVPIANRVPAHPVGAMHAATTLPAHYKKVLDFTSNYQLLMEHSGLLSDSLAEPVWVGADEIVAHANLGDGFLIGEYRLNLRTGTIRHFDLEPQISDCKPAHWAISPDHKRVLWLQGHLDHDTFTIYCARLDGSGSQSWKADVKSDDGDLRWMPDGHRFVCFQRQRGDGSAPYVRALIYDSAAPRRIPVSIALPPALQCGRIVGFLPDGAVLTLNDFQDESRGRVPNTILTSFRLESPATSARHYPVRFPDGEGADFALLSPDGKSLAWASRSHGDKDDGTVWISRADGTRLHRLGAVPGLLTGWYPNSRALLFESGNFFGHPRHKELDRVDLK